MTTLAFNESKIFRVDKHGNLRNKINYTTLDFTEITIELFGLCRKNCLNNFDFD